MLYCPNYTCQTPNTETNRFCQKCRTPLPKRYLWAVGEQATTYQPGELLADRYLCKQSHIFLDTKPGLVPADSLEVPAELVPYLKLSPYQLHIPQIYDLIRLSPDTGEGIALLDRAALTTPLASLTEHNPFEDVADHQVAQVLPSWGEMWPMASALRQLYWLWQIANLWYPLSVESAASTLLTPELLRVDGAIIRIQALRLTSANEAAPPLRELGALWSSMVPRSHTAIRSFLTTLCQQMVREDVRTAEQVVSQLDQAMQRIGPSLQRQVHVATLTDQGPSRQRNEDACYPPSGTVAHQPIAAASPTPTLVIVCDGIGGHEGGNVASNLAIETVQQLLQALPLDTLDPTTLALEMEKAVCAANDVISQRNDSERRFDRKRMGTTLVMALVRQHELFMAHIGDSRAYWMTRQSCQQVTQDDDVASREVRLGYSFHRDALQQPGAGSLVQALGMASSTMLHPSVQRFILDEDSVFLLCSDGLSDNDRVEELWDVEVLPILMGKTDVAIASQRLVEAANTLNGHDNVTVGLIHIQVEPGEPATSLPPAAQTTQSSPAPGGAATLVVGRSAAADPAPGTTPAGKTQQVTPQRSTSPPSILGLMVGIVALLGIGGALALILFPGLHTRLNALLGRQPPPPSPEPTLDSSTRSPTPLMELRAPSFVQLSAATPSPGSVPDPPLVLSVQTPQEQATNSELGIATPDALGIVPSGSIVYVLKRIKVSDDVWLQLRLCSNGLSLQSGREPQPDLTAPAPTTADGVPNPAATDPATTPLRSLQAGELGWAKETDVLTLGRPSAIELTPDQQVQCAQPTRSAPEPISGLPAGSSVSVRIAEHSRDQV